MNKAREIRLREERKRNIRLIAATAIIVFIGFSYFLISKTGILSSTQNIPDTIVADEPLIDTFLVQKKSLETKELNNVEVVQKDTPVLTVYTEEEKPVIPKAPDKSDVAVKKLDEKATEAPQIPQRREEKLSSVYKVVSIAHFYNQPNEQTRRKAFINHWNNSYASLKPQDEKNGFIYVVFKNHLGQTSKGWLRKKDLKEVGSLANNNNKE